MGFPFDPLASPTSVLSVVDLLTHPTAAFFAPHHRERERSYPSLCMPLCLLCIVGGRHISYPTPPCYQLISVPHPHTIASISSDTVVRVDIHFFVCVPLCIYRCCLRYPAYAFLNKKPVVKRTISVEQSHAVSTYRQCH